MNKFIIMKSLIYNTKFELHTLNELFNNKPFFRKKYYSNLEINTSIEHNIAQILFVNPQPNIVNIYRINKNYYDIELLNTNIDTILNIKYNYNSKSKLKIDKTIIKKQFYSAKQQLQHLGIIYIDWKLDNVGIDSNNIIKIFDFDCSGIYDIKNPSNWIIEPIMLNNYKKAIKNNIKNPIDIDNYLFEEEIIKKII